MSDCECELPRHCKPVTTQLLFNLTKLSIIKLSFEDMLANLENGLMMSYASLTTETILFAEDVVHITHLKCVDLHEATPRRMESQEEFFGFYWLQCLLCRSILSVQMFGRGQNLLCNSHPVVDGT